MKNRQRLFILFYCFIALFFVNSCKKDTTSEFTKGFIKIISSDEDVSVMSFFESEDNNYLIVGRSMSELNPGYAIKVNNEGNVIWYKRLSNQNNVMWKVCDIPGNGFITVGHQGISNINYFTVCKYSDEGDLIQTKNLSVPFTIVDEQGYTSPPFDFKQLSNGKYVFIGEGITSLGNNKGYLFFTDNEFNIEDARFFDYGPEFNALFAFQGICEMPDNSIAFAGIKKSSKANLQFWTNKVLYRTSLTGDEKSLTFEKDTFLNETPNAAFKSGSDIVVVSSSMPTLDIAKEGTFVNYLNDFTFKLVSGRITLTRYNMEGEFIEKKTIDGYPLNGMINSVNKTSDEGFILCGSVGQANNANLLSTTKVFLLKIDANLNTEWSKVISTNYPSYGAEALQTSDGGYLVSGHRRSSKNKFDFILIKTDKFGNIY